MRLLHDVSDGLAAHADKDKRVSAATNDASIPFAPVVDPSTVARAAPAESQEEEEITVPTDKSLPIPTGVIIRTIQRGRDEGQIWTE
eukprot:5527406-Amphidinium_carterae.1